MKTPFQMAIKLACAVALGTVASSTLAVVRYECLALETGSYVFATTSAINSAGEVVGFSDFVSGGRNAARWSVDGSATQLNDLVPGDSGYGGANGINDLGVVVGYSWTDNYASYLPVTWDGTTPITLPLRSGDAVGSAFGVNRRGVIVGSSGPEKYGQTHAVMWRKGKVIDLGTLGNQSGQASRSSTALAISSLGVVVGSSDTETADTFHATWWDTNRQIHDLGTLAGGQNSVATSINDKGVIVGRSDFGGGNTMHAVAWVDGVVRDLGAPLGYEESRASGINHSGTAVGTAYGSSASVALVWPGLNRAPRDLNMLLTNRCESGAGNYQLTRASAVNRDGVIAAIGTYIDALGGVHYGAFKLVPVPANTAVK